jgi:hypothetical protein
MDGVRNTITRYHCRSCLDSSLARRLQSATTTTTTTTARDVHYFFDASRTARLAKSYQTCRFVTRSTVRLQGYFAAVAHFNPFVIRLGLINPASRALDPERWKALIPLQHQHT